MWAGVVATNCSREITMPAFVTSGAIIYNNFKFGIVHCMKLSFNTSGTARFFESINNVYYRFHISQLFFRFSSNSKNFAVFT